MQKLYIIIMRLCDWKLIPMIEAVSTQVTENIRKLWNIILGHSNETPSYPKLLIIWSTYLAPRTFWALQVEDVFVFHLLPPPNSVLLIPPWKARSLVLNSFGN
ncbi:hypothetical protein Lal_00039946, partial [Lupinus albus]